MRMKEKRINEKMEKGENMRRGKNGEGRKSDDERERKKERNERMEKGGKGERMPGQKECDQTSRDRREDKKTRRRAGRE